MSRTGTCARRACGCCGREVEDFAGLFDVSHATARAMLDGLVAQGKMRVSMAGTRLRFYEAADA